MNNTLITERNETMKQEIIDDFLTKSIKAPGYEPSAQTREGFGEWIISNPSGTYKDWKEYLNKTTEKGGQS